MNARRLILVVEDDLATRQLLTHQIQRAGLEVVAFENGRLALEAIVAQGGGLVVADWGMPEMDGLELCRTLRQMEQLETLGSVYFVLLSANDSKESVVTGLAAGANDYLTKPYHEGEMLARLRVGERMLALQEELLLRTREFQKANAQLAVLSRKLDELANTDILSQLANRRCILERLGEACRHAAQHNQPLACIMVDVDRFKQVNDTYGHDAGDQVIRDVAAVLRCGARRPEHCGRLGGEEFIVLAPWLAAPAAVELAERLRVAIQAHIVTCGQHRLRVTASFGVAPWTRKTADPDALLKQADAMLYAAKQNGRNQTWAVVAAGQGSPAAGLTSAAPHTQSCVDS